MRVCFCCRPFKSPESAGYQHTAIGLAEGLRQLGHEVYANVDYWAKTADRDDSLFRHDPDVGPEDCDVEVANSILFQYDEPAPEGMRTDTGNKTVLLDQSDGIFSVARRDSTPEFDVVLRTHMSSYWNYPSHYEPWAFGLTSRLMKYTSDWSTAEKDDKVLVNFRTDHTVRKIAERDIIDPLSEYLELDTRTDDFDPAAESSYDQYLWKVTGRRHYPSYYERLKSALTAVFGGWFLPSQLLSSYPTLARLGRRAEVVLEPVRRALGRRTYGVFQWDSFRLWEAWAAGSVPLHLDFKEYGLELPVTPSNYDHYVGFDLNRLEHGVERLTEKRAKLDDIAEAGSAWVRDHYSPQAQAERFLDLI
jgi:hypothetical protein